MIGGGTFGNVYKGQLTDGKNEKELCIKQVYNTLPEEHLSSPLLVLQQSD